MKEQMNNFKKKIYNDLKIVYQCSEAEMTMEGCKFESKIKLIIKAIIK